MRPGERIPVDGRVIEGPSELDNSLLTGETAPAAVGVGAACRAGALNLSGTLHLAATARSKAAAIYVPVVHAAAALTFVGGWALGLGLREALIRAMAVLIVTCPCALGLAVPAVQITASARLFRRGVLVKSGAALERLAEVDHVVLDKTGVLTVGGPRLQQPPPPELIFAAALARASRHPLANALADAAGEGRSPKTSLNILAKA